MRIKKKNTRGNARNFITRSQAVRKLQVSLADFRRLCIFKGIYPREPRNKRKANKGSTAPATFYYTKDIQYLMHEPVLAKFREHKTFAKRLTRALGRGEVSTAKRLETNRSTYTLDHIVRERYPGFRDAIRDIDDALNMVFLFANLPATNQIAARVVKDAQEISDRWSAYVARERLVRKVFVSIKGVYYQASIKGEDVRWLVPYKFPENIPTDIDLRIMMTFLEFYTTLLHFVLFKLYTDSGLVYPPKINVERSKLVSGITSYILKSRDEAPMPTESDSKEAVSLDAETIESALTADKSKPSGERAEDNDYQSEDEHQLDSFEDNSKNKGDILSQPSQFDSPVSTLFNDFVFFIGREVPLDIVEFLILACGGRVISEVALDQLSSKEGIDLEKITHQIVDRPVIKSKVPGRTYIQPQWIFDSINKSELASANLYMPGETLPPHLSPWGDASGYDPEAEDGDQDEDSSAEEIENSVDNEDESPENAIDEDDETDDALATQKELELEAKGVRFSDVKDGASKSKSKKRKLTESEEEKNLKMIMMSNKQRKLYKKMKHSNAQKDDKVAQLKKKKKKLASTISRMEKK